MNVLVSLGMAAACAALALGCTSSNKPTPESAHGAKLPAEMPISDAPYELASDRDLEEVRDRYDAMAVTDPERTALRRELAAEYLRRAKKTLDDPDRRYQSYQSMLSLYGLWTPQELARASAAPAAHAAELRPYVAFAREMRRTFARSGGDGETAFSLLFQNSRYGFFRIFIPIKPQNNSVS